MNMKYRNMKLGRLASRKANLPKLLFIKELTKKLVEMVHVNCITVNFVNGQTQESNFDLSNKL